MQTKEIKKWLLDADLELKKVADQAGCVPGLVSMVIRGERRYGDKAKKVVRVLKKLGCPQEFLRGGKQAA